MYSVNFASPLQYSSQRYGTTSSYMYPPSSFNSVALGGISLSGYSVSEKDDSLSSRNRDCSMTGVVYDNYDNRRRHSSSLLSNEHSTWSLKGVVDSSGLSNHRIPNSATDTRNLASPTLTKQEVCEQDITKSTHKSDSELQQFSSYKENNVQNHRSNSIGEKFRYDYLSSCTLSGSNLNLAGMSGNYTRGTGYTSFYPYTDTHLGSERIDSNGNTMNNNANTHIGNTTTSCLYSSNNRPATADSSRIDNGNISDPHTLDNGQHVDGGMDSLLFQTNKENKHESDTLLLPHNQHHSDMDNKHSGM